MISSFRWNIKPECLERKVDVDQEQKECGDQAEHAEDEQCHDVRSDVHLQQSTQKQTNDE